jgi:glycosyltransferase involved in cell wall biosynthesis
MIVSCICPTADRREFMPRAFRCFEEQVCPDFDLELIVLDDGHDRIDDLVPSDHRIKYFYETPKRDYGQKINRCAELASGEFVIHWDSDDFYPANRVSRQVLPLLENEKLLVSGTSTINYYKHGTKEAYVYTGNKAAWIGGICYRKSAWEKKQFDDLLEPGADARWLRDIPTDARFDLADPFLIIGAIHDTNHSRKTCIGNHWKPIDWSLVAHAVSA